MSPCGLARFYTRFLIGGLVSAPVIAALTGVGRGAGLNGLAVLKSCECFNICSEALPLPAASVCVLPS